MGSLFQLASYSATDSDKVDVGRVEYLHWKFDEIERALLIIIIIYYAVLCVFKKNWEPVNGLSLVCRLNPSSSRGLPSFSPFLRHRKITRIHN